MVDLTVVNLAVQWVERRVDLRVERMVGKKVE